MCRCDVEKSRLDGDTGWPIHAVKENRAGFAEAARLIRAICIHSSAPPTTPPSRPVHFVDSSPRLYLSKKQTQPTVINVL